MMFGARPGPEDWSTEDEADVDDIGGVEDDEDDVDTEDDDDDDSYDSETDEKRIWEAPAKNYSNMNLKEAVSKERESKMHDDQDGLLLSYHGQSVNALATYRAAGFVACAV